MNKEINDKGNWFLTSFPLSLYEQQNNFFSNPDF